jgi:hypothetical protein
MLDEFVDIIVDDLPNTLPHVRSISHHIDLILEQVCLIKQPKE